MLHVISGLEARGTGIQQAVLLRSTRHKVGVARARVAREKLPSGLPQTRVASVPV